MVAALHDRSRLHNWNGVFLGSSIAIKKSGFSVLAAFLLAALGTFLVFQQLAKLTADHPVEGSFCSYAREPRQLGGV